MTSIRLLGVPIEVGNRDGLLSKTLSFVGNGGCVFTPNPIILSNSLKNASLRRALLSADLCIPDGVGLLPYLRREDPFAEVLAGVDLGRKLLEKTEGISLGIVGGRKGIAERAFVSLQGSTRGLKPTFLLDGYQTKLSDLLSCLKNSQPDVVFVCLGSPFQEILCASLRVFSGKTLFLALGGSLDVYSGEKKRAPEMIRAMHLEWLYRMAREPWRFRDLPKLVRFPFLCHNYRETNHNFTKNNPPKTQN